MVRRKSPERIGCIESIAVQTRKRFESRSTFWGYELLGVLEKKYYIYPCSKTNLVRHFFKRSSQKLKLLIDVFILYHMCFRRVFT